jgi:bacterioferritin-associated ferredoxin
MDDSQPLHPAIRGLKTVCRCNNIKYRTIERAIREGARTVDDVAKRTGATTGHCGGSCTPEILEMLAELAAAPATSGPAESRGSVSAAGEMPVGSSLAGLPHDAGGAANANAWWVRKK